MDAQAIFFPFDLFGSAGAGAGAELLSDAFRELLADNRRETLPTRALCYQDRIRHRLVPFETIRDVATWRQRGRRLVRKCLNNDQFFLWVAGNHLGTLPVYDELGQEAERTLVVQLDAHLDIYNLADCTSELSHGNFLLHTACKLPAVVNLGHREQLLTPEYIGKFYREAHAACDLGEPKPALDGLRKLSRSFPRVFLDIDCDVFDPAYFPAVLHPLPFGISPSFLLRCIDAIEPQRLCGVGISEFTPARDRDDQSLALLVWLIEHLLLERFEGIKR